MSVLYCVYVCNGPLKDIYTTHDFSCVYTEGIFDMDLHRGTE